MRIVSEAVSVADAKSKLKGKDGKYDPHPFIELAQTIKDHPEKVFAITCEENERPRMLMLRIARAATAVGVKLDTGIDRENEKVVYAFSAEEKEPRRKYTKKADAVA